VRVRWTRPAVRQLAAIGSYIAERDPKAAERIEARLREAVELVARFPAAGRPGRISGTRELVVPGTPYVVPYRVESGSVDILAIFHAAQNRPLT
jgi:addiction module RelE/StbE family toxin